VQRGAIVQSECVYSYPTNAAGERGALVDFNSLQMFAQSSHSRCVDFAYSAKCLALFAGFPGFLRRTMQRREIKYRVIVYEILIDSFGIFTKKVFLTHIHRENC
jgi:hypothetical protein